jgi:FAD/FMN-containing dehydrogenase
MQDAGLERVGVTTDHAGLWAQQRAGQRSSDGLAIVRVAAPPTALPAVLAAVDACGGTLVGRAALGTSYVEVDPAAIGRLGSALPETAIRLLLDGPDELRRSGDPWGPIDPGVLEVMRRIKLRFDPAGACNPGVFAGGI